VIMKKAVMRHSCSLLVCLFIEMRRANLARLEIGSCGAGALVSGQSIGRSSCTFVPIMHFVSLHNKALHNKALHKAFHSLLTDCTLPADVLPYMLRQVSRL
jgi:hypothetical protein